MYPAFSLSRTSIALPLAFSICFCALAQQRTVQREGAQPSEVAEDFEVRLLELRYDSMDVIENILEAFHPQGLMITSKDSRARIIGIQGPPVLLDLAEEYVKKYDVKNKDVEIIVYLIEGEADGASTAVPDELTAVVEQSTAVPDELTAVVEELSKVFVYDTFHLLESVVCRVRDGSEANTFGVLPLREGLDASEWEPGRYQITLRRVSVGNEEADRHIRIDNLGITVSGPNEIKPPSPQPTRVVQRGGFPGADMTLGTTVEVAEGEMVVVGKANFEGGNKALFVVLTGRVVD